MKRIGVLFLLLISIPHYAVADIMCDDAATDYHAVYEPKSYTCKSGYYLPANTDGCIACPQYHYCSGGTFTFNTDNTDEDQGIVISCPSGYFVPANTDGCIACPAGYTCAGGSFSFNENEYQGAEINSIGTSTMNNVCAVNFPTDMYAVYEPKTVALNFDDGNGNTTTTTCTYDGLVNLPATIPTRPGYDFAGWKVERNE